MGVCVCPLKRCSLILVGNLWVTQLGASTKAKIDWSWRWICLVRWKWVDQCIRKRRCDSLGLDSPRLHPQPNFQNRRLFLADWARFVHVAPKNHVHRISVRIEAANPWLCTICLVSYANINLRTRSTVILEKRTQSSTLVGVESYFSWT